MDLDFAFQWYARPLPLVLASLIKSPSRYPGWKTLRSIRKGRQRDPYDIMEMAHQWAEAQDIGLRIFIPVGKEVAWIDMLTHSIRVCSMVAAMEWGCWFWTSSNLRLGILGVISTVGSPCRWNQAFWRISKSTLPSCTYALLAMQTPWRLSKIFKPWNTKWLVDGLW